MMRLNLALFFTLLTNSVIASDYEVNDLFELTFEELLDVTIITVSKRDESLDEAPGIITVFSSDDIRRFGARNVIDVLSRVPNFYMFNSSTFNATGNTLRAGASQHLNNHVLYLINGRPLRESQNGGRHTDINLLFPIESIKRIEVLRGPGSVLYGSNAFNGVINIITKSSKEKSGGNLYYSLGSNGYNSLSVDGSFNAENNAYINAQINKHSEDGVTITAYDDQFQMGSSQLFRTGYLARVEAGYKGINVETIKSEIELPAISGQFRWTGLVEWKLIREYYNFGYQHEFNDNWTSAFNYTKNQSGLVPNDPTANQYETNGDLYEFTVNGSINDFSDVVFGMVNEHVKGDLGALGGKYESVRRSLYGQIDYRFSIDTKLTAGTQWNKSDSQPTHTSPRLALVHRFNDKWTTKAMYSEAYRSPFGSEIAFESGFLNGDPDLEPETIQTTEFQFIYSISNIHFATTFYQSMTDNLIGRQRLEGSTVFLNIDQEINYEGIEFEGRWAITPTLQFLGNASYQQTEDESGIKDIMISPNEMIKFGLTYESELGFTASFWNNYFGDVNKLEDLPDSNVLVANPEAKAVNLLSINIVGNLGRVLNNSVWQDVEFSIFVENLMDEDVWFPEMGQKSVNTFPQAQDRSVYLNMSYKF